MRILNKLTAIFTLSVFNFFLFVERVMFSACKNDKVFDSVVRTVSVYMMNMLMLFKRSPKNCFHDIPMLRIKTVVYPYLAIAVSQFEKLWFFMLNLPVRFGPTFFGTDKAFGVFCAKFILTDMTSFSNKKFPCFSHNGFVPIPALQLPFSIIWFFHNSSLFILYKGQYTIKGEVCQV